MVGIVRVTDDLFCGIAWEEPVPDYSTGVYVSTLSSPTIYEKKLYAHVLGERRNMTVDEVLAQWVSAGQDGRKVAS